MHMRACAPERHRLEAVELADQLGADVHTCMHTYAYAYACIRICIHTCACVIDICACVRMYAHVHVCVCTYMCVYMYRADVHTIGEGRVRCFGADHARRYSWDGVVVSGTVLEASE